MSIVTIHDLQDLESPVVKRALARKCGACPAPKGQPCDTPTGVVHFCRATTHYSTEAKKRRAAR